MKRVHLQAVMLAIAPLVFLAIISTLVYRVNNWFDHNRFVFRSPIEVRLYTPIAIEERKTISPIAEATPSGLIQPVMAAEPAELTNEQIVSGSKYTKLIDYIWMSESSRGLNNLAEGALHLECRREGKTNEFGFAAGVSHCFGSFRESVTRLERWIDENREGKTNEQLLCFYNTGYVLNSCTYTENWED
jgi:hypothetical protein